jgi:hypothetical protein
MTSPSFASVEYDPATSGYRVNCGDFTVEHTRNGEEARTVASYLNMAYEKRFSDRVNEKVEEAATIADRWSTHEQKSFGEGGPGEEIRALKVKP